MLDYSQIPWIMLCNLQALQTHFCCSVLTVVCVWVTSQGSSSASPSELFIGKQETHNWDWLGLFKWIAVTMSCWSFMPSLNYFTCSRWNWQNKIYAWLYSLLLLRWWPEQEGKIRKRTESLQVCKRQSMIKQMWLYYLLGNFLPPILVAGFFVVRLGS